MRFLLSVTLAAVFLISAPAFSQDEENDDTYKQLKLFGEVFERVRADFVEEVSDRELIEAAIEGMLADLDPHSGYLDSESFKDMREQTRGEFGGLGIEVTMEDGVVKVVSPIDDTPAFRAGVQAGDLITHIDGEPIMGMNLNEAVKLMRGPVDTNIEVTIRRGNEEPFDLEITRDIIQVQSVRSRVEEDIGYIRLTSFTEQTMSGLEEAFGEIRDELGDDMKGIVLDMRNNPGGLLDQAISVSDAFLDRGEIVSTRGRTEDEAQRWNAEGGDMAEGLPIVVLINGGSASASEIVAGALQDHRRAIVLGTPSFGKGSVQTVIPLSGNGAMRLTTARYYTPSGRSIQAKGIEPDILVEQARLEKLDNGRIRREEDLPRHLENDFDNGVPTEIETPDSQEQGNSEDEEEPMVSPEDQGDPEQDYQLARALDLLRGLSLLSQLEMN
ncbi:S41 family peptidase [Fodinicurvata fenggangensis]|uniref:S41 family peptidase n=1 Tax=Fodinicurvata fenggangensis TaxID=1121830 RepID=UPI00047C2450|nr:S41 family peptidase [Fodinicurvata fenggangensis]